MSDRELSREEQQIEYGEDLRPASRKTKERVERIIQRAKKNQAISLRISAYDLQRLKELALREGIPYQTLISAVLHKYVTHQLYDKNEVLKTLSALKEAT